MQSRDVSHATWHLPNAQMRFVAQSLLIEQPSATLDGGGVLLQLEALMTAPSAKGRPRIHAERAPTARVQRRFVYIVTNPFIGFEICFKEHGAGRIARRASPLVRS
jgi:hypothetical protein